MRMIKWTCHKCKDDSIVTIGIDPQGQTQFHCSTGTCKFAMRIPICAACKQDLRKKRCEHFPLKNVFAAEVAQTPPKEAIVEEVKPEEPKKKSKK